MVARLNYLCLNKSTHFWSDCVVELPVYLNKFTLTFEVVVCVTVLNYLCILNFHFSLGTVSSQLIREWYKLTACFGFPQPNTLKTIRQNGKEGFFVILNSKQELAYSATKILNFWITGHDLEATFNLLVSTDLISSPHLIFFWVPTRWPSG